MRNSPENVHGKSETFPLSKLQQGLLLHSELASKNQFYISQIRVQISAKIDTKRLQECCQLIMDKHAILRASVSSKDLQHATLIIHPHIKIKLKIIDISELASSVRESRLQTLLDQDFSKQINITKAPLMRWTLIKIDPENSLLLWTHHHALLSGNEIAKILMELFAHYDGLNVKTEMHTYDYGHYLQILKNQEFSLHEQYWLDLLKGYEPKNLLIEEKNKVKPQYKHAIIAENIQKNNLEKMAKKYNVSEYTILSSAWAIVLSLFTNEVDVVFGSVRSFPEKSLQNVAGLFINTLPIRVLLHQDMRIEELYSNIRAQQIKLRDLVHTPLGDINKLLQLQPGQSLFETYIDYKPLSINQILKNQQGAWDKRSWDYRLDTHYKLYLEIYGENSELVLRIHYDANKYQEHTIIPLMNYYKSVLLQLLSDTNDLLVNIDGMNNDAKKQWQTACVGASRAYSKDPVITQFESMALQNPNAIAIVEDQIKLTYSELNQLANQLAHKIAKTTSVNNRYIGVCLAKSHRYIVAIMAILKTGNAYVPLDPAYPLVRLQQISANCEMPLLIVEQDIQVNKNQLVYPIDLLDESTESLAIVTTSNAPVYAIFTSGSTGIPKGVAISQQALSHLVQWHQHTYAIDANKKIALLSPFTFDAATWMMWSALANGAELHLVNPSIIKDPILLQTWLLNSKINQAFIPSAMVQFLLKLKWPAKHGFNTILTGGEKLNLNAMPPKNIAVINHYGPTEYTVITTANLNYSDLTDINYIGKPIDNTILHIKDVLGRASPIQIPGELWISGEGLSQGYINAPDKQHAFITDANGIQYYKTGDTVRLLKDGNIEFIGRNDEQVKVRGYRIELGEIEKVFAKCPGIHACCVTVITNNNSQKQIVLYYTKSKSTLNQTQLMLWAKKNLPGYMIPNHFMPMNEFTLTAHGKIDKTKLPEMTTQSVTSELVEKMSTSYSVVYAIIGSILALPTQALNYNASLFEYGGDSITIMQLVQQFYTAGFIITADQIFKHPIIADIATLAINNKKKQNFILPTLKIRNSFHVTAVQQWYLPQAELKKDQFNQSIVITLHKKLDIQKLEAAFLQLIKKHDALRLHFNSGRKGWRGSSKEKKSQFKLHLGLVKPTDVYFDLTKGLLVFAAVDNDKNPQKLFIAIHHLAVDVVSWKILTRDLEAFYLDGASQSNSNLSFQQWAQVARQYAVRIAKNESGYYWRNKIAQMRKMIPNSIETVPHQWSDVQQLKLIISNDITHLLLGKANAAYNTKVLDLIITAFLNSFAIQKNLIRTLALLIEGHGRTEIEEIQPSQTVGWFTTMMPLVIQSKAKTTRQQIRLVKESLVNFQKRAFEYSLLSLVNPDEFAQAIENTELIGLNYLGVIRNSSDSDNILQDASNIQFTVNPQKNRTLSLELQAYVYQDQLQIELAYNSKVYNRNEMQDKLNTFKIALDEIVKHCCAQTSRHYSVCDFPLVQTSQMQLDVFFRESTIPFFKASLKKHAKVTDLYPLSPLQEGIQYHALKRAESDFYHVQTLLEIKNTMNVPLFKQAVLKVFGHFNIFKTGFVSSHNLGSMQFVVSELSIPWQYYDWTQFSEKQAEKLSQLILIDRERFFNLTNPPLIRFYLIKLSDTQYHFMFSYHHIVLDGWSMAMVVTALFDYYHALLNDQLYHLSMMTSYSPYVAWTLGGDSAKAKSYWSKLLASFQTSTKLTNENYLADLTEEYETRARCSKLLSETHTQLLREFASKHDLTLNTLLLGAWCYLIARFADIDDVVIGTTLAARPAQIENVNTMIGLLNSTIPVRAQYQNEELILKYLKRIQNQLIESQKYQYSKLVDINACSGLAANESLINYLFVLENYPLDKQKLKKYHIESLKVIEKPHYKITLTIVALEQIEFNLSYDKAMLTEADIEQMLTSYLDVVTSLPTLGDATMNKLEILNPSARKELLKNWRGHDLDFDRALTLKDYYAKQYQRIPNKTAIIFNNIAVNYQQLNQRSNQFANQFIEDKIKPGNVIAVILDRDLNLIYTLVAIVKLGCTFLPIDPAFPKQRINDIIKTAQPHLIVTKKLFTKGLQAKHIKILAIDISMPDILVQPNIMPDWQVSNETPAYILFTSGSTGKPKGVVISYASLLNFLHSAKKMTNVDEHHHFLISTTYSFDIFNYEFHLPLLMGATATLIDHHDQISGQNLINIITTNAIDVIQATPVTWNLLFAVGFIPNKMQKFVCGGDVMTKQLAATMRANGSEVYNIYGPSETTIWSSCHKVCDIDETIGSIPIGQPMHNTYFYLLNTHMQFVPTNVVGTLYIGGEGLGLGYLKNKKLTQQKFIPDPYLPGKMIYNTGDLVKYLRNEAFLFVGRSDNQVKIHGYRIELSEIESQLNHIEEIKQSAVIIKQKNTEKQMIAFLTAQDNHSKLSIESIRNLLADKLPQFMLPTHFEYIDDMPLSSNHKINKKELSEFKLKIPNKKIAKKIASKYHKLMQVWAEVLKLDVNDVNIDDNFFEKGGNSIQAVALIAKINHALHAEYGVNDLFVYPTIRALYKQLQQSKRKIDYTGRQDLNTLAPPIVCLQKTGTDHPIFLLHPIGGTLYIYQPLIAALGKSRTIYGIFDPSITAGNLLFSSFREMATYYVSLIKQKQAKGPYHLLGASFGANMVEEITKQLTQHGDTVAFTGLIDGWAHYPAKANKKEWFYTNLTRQHKMVADMMGQDNQELPKSLLAINWHRQQLLAKHELSYSENKITLFKARDLTPVLRSIDSEFNYWDMYYPAGINLHIVPGDHETMLLPPNVKTLAEHIIMYLSK